MPHRLSWRCQAGSSSRRLLSIRERTLFSSPWLHNQQTKLRKPFIAIQAYCPAMLDPPYVSFHYRKYPVSSCGLEAYGLMTVELTRWRHPRCALGNPGSRTLRVRTYSIPHQLYCCRVHEGRCLRRRSTVGLWVPGPKSRSLPSLLYGATSICRQAAGSSASVISRLGFTGVVGNFGCSTGSLNQ